MTPATKSSPFVALFCAAAMTLVTLGYAPSALAATAAPMNMVLSKDKVEYRAPVTLSGKVAAGGVRKVIVQVSTSKTKSFKTFKTTPAATGQDGSYAITITPSNGSYYYRTYVDKKTTVAAQKIAAIRTVTIKLNRAEEYYVNSKASSKKVSFKATLSYAAKGKYARLQRLSPGSNPRKPTWKTIKKVKLKKTGENKTVSLGSTKVPRGRWAFRVISDASSKSTSGIKASAVHLVSCPTTASAPGSVAQAFSNPAKYSDKKRVKRTKALMTAWVKYICAADTNSTINVAIWMLDDDVLYKSKFNISNQIIGALDYVHKVRGAKISLIQDDVNAQTTDGQTEDWVRQIAGGTMGADGRVPDGRYYRCRNSCMSDRQKSGPEANVAPGYMHAKFMTIDKTLWSGNVVAVGTANWSYWQLRDYWNSFTAFRNRPALADRLNAHFNAMVASATRSSNANPFASWMSPAADSANPAQDQLEKRTAGTYSVWTALTGQGEKTDGSVSVAFSPQPRNEDSIIDRLNKYTCKDPAHRTVRVGMYFASNTVGLSFSAALKRLKDDGCDVKYVMSLPVNPKTKGVVKTDKVSLNQLQKDLGATNVRCTALMHSKNIMVDAHLGDNKEAEQSVWTAARNMDYSGLRLSDEVSVRITGYPSTYGAFIADWKLMNAAGKQCSNKVMGY